VLCAICRQPFKQITAKHLKTHDLTLKEYREKYEDIHPPALQDPTESQVSRGEVFDSIATWIAQDSQLTPIAHRVVESLLMDEGKRFQVAIRAVAAARLERAKDMLLTMDRVEAQLYDPTRIATASTEELLAIKRVLDRDMSSLTDLLLQITQPKGQHAHGGTPLSITLQQVVDNRQQLVVGGDFPVPDDPREREKLVSAIRQIQAMAATPQVQPA
jgi:hypothetical protein